MEENTKKVATVRKGGVSDSGKPTEAINNNDREGYRLFSDVIGDGEQNNVFNKLSYGFK